MGFKVGLADRVGRAGDHWLLGACARRIRGVLSSPANGTGSPLQYFTCDGSPPARTSLTRRARRKGEGALEAWCSELARPAESIARVGRGSGAHSQLERCFLQSVSREYAGSWVSEPRLWRQKGRGVQSLCSSFSSQRSQGPQVSGGD